MSLSSSAFADAMPHAGIAAPVVQRAQAPRVPCVSLCVDPLEQARAFIHAHFDEPLTIAQLADVSSLSVSRFATVFRERFGEAPYRYLCSVRVAAAQRLLLDGLPGSLVATEVGFFDQSHLARHFKRICGMTPGAFVQRGAKAPSRLAGPAG